VKQSLDLSALAPDYEVVGELDAVTGSLAYLAKRTSEGKRRDDRTGVVITVFSTPEGDEANALSHLAADTKLLAEARHRRLIPVIEGRWLGEDAFAVVTERTTDPSLAERLMSGESFTNPRIAAILRDVNGLLQWAREQKVVHRGIPASNVFLEPKTDRVRASFAIAPIRRLHHSDAHDDARTIARLAMAMLTGEVDPRAYEGETLAELRSDLPEQLVSATAALLDAKSGDQEPDVAAYLALIGMADPVAAGEAERERIRAEILDEQNAERERLAAERAAFEQTMATERATFEQTMATERAAFERAQEQERERLERAQTQEREKLERERQELQAAATRERESLQRAAVAERTQVAAKRAELEKAEKRLTAQRAELERVAARDRQQLADLREELRQAGEREIELKRATALDDIADREDELDRPDLVAPTFVAPMLKPLEPFRFDDSPLMSEKEIVFAPSRMAEPEPDVVEATGSPTPADEVGAPSTPNRRRWILAGSAAAILALVGITASMLGGRDRARQPGVQLVVPTTRTSAAPPAAQPARAIPSPAAAVPAAPVAPVAPVALVLDSASSRAAARWLDSLKEAHPVELPRRVRIVREPAADERPRERPASIERPRPSITEDPFFIPGSTPVPRDTVVRRDSVPPPRIRR